MDIPIDVRLLALASTAVEHRSGGQVPGSPLTPHVLTTLGFSTRLEWYADANLDQWSSVPGLVTSPAVFLMVYTGSDEVA